MKVIREEQDTEKTADTSTMEVDQQQEQVNQQHEQPQAVDWSDNVDELERERKNQENKIKLNEDIQVLLNEYEKETDIRIRTQLMKYISILRTAKKNNEIFDFPGGT